MFAGIQSAVHRLRLEPDPPRGDEFSSALGLFDLLSDSPVALFLLGGVIRFLTEPWKKKGESLLTTLLVLLVLAVVAFLVLRRVPLPGM